MKTVGVITLTYLGKGDFFCFSSEFGNILSEKYFFLPWGPMNNLVIIYMKCDHKIKGMHIEQLNHSHRECKFILRSCGPC